MRRTALTIAVPVALVVAACASPTTESSTTSESATSSSSEIQTTTSMATSQVVGLVALGHSVSLDSNPIPAGQTGTQRKIRGRQVPILK